MDSSHGNDIEKIKKFIEKYPDLAFLLILRIQIEEKIKKEKDENKKKKLTELLKLIDKKIVELQNRIPTISSKDIANLEGILKRNIRSSLSKIDIEKTSIPNIGEWQSSKVIESSSPSNKYINLLDRIFEETESLVAYLMRMTDLSTMERIRKVIYEHEDKNFLEKYTNIFQSIERVLSAMPYHLYEVSSRDYLPGTSRMEILKKMTTLSEDLKYMLKDFIQSLFIDKYIKKYYDRRKQ